MRWSPSETNVSDDTVSDRLRQAVGWTTGDWGLAGQLHHTDRTCGAHYLTCLQTSPLTQHALVPFGFRRQVSCRPNGLLLSTAPFCERNLLCADTAHDAAHEVPVALEGTVRVAAAPLPPAHLLFPAAYRTLA